MCAALFFPATEGTKFDADGYVNGHGMSFGLEDQKPQPPKPPSSPLGLFFPAGLSFAGIVIRFNIVIRFKMKTPKTLENYPAKHIDEIIDRIIALRVRWLRHVEIQLASQQSRLVLEHYKLGTEIVE